MIDVEWILVINAVLLAVIGYAVTVNLMAVQNHLDLLRAELRAALYTYDSRGAGDSALARILTEIEGVNVTLPDIDDESD